MSILLSGQGGVDDSLLADKIRHYPDLGKTPSPIFCLYDEAVNPIFWLNVVMI